MLHGKTPRGIKRIGFLLIDDFALMSIAVAVEAVRAANHLSDREIFHMRFLSAEGGEMQTTVGAYFKTEPANVAPSELDLVLVAAAGNPMTFDNAKIAAYLRKLDAHGVALGGLSGGGAILARLGLLKDRRFTVHWHHYNAVKNESDQYLIEQSLFVIDRDRYTCAGGIGTLDMMHALISAEHGADLARSVSEWYIHDLARAPESQQRSGATGQFGIAHPTVLDAVQLMASHIADPLAMTQIAGLCGISHRQMSRLFRAQFSTPAQKFYRSLRLTKAKDLIEQTRVPVSDVATATGFQNSSHFARLFRQEYAVSPLRHRAASRLHAEGA